jgi:hypothetical protein
MDRQTIMMASIAILVLVSFYLYRENQKLKSQSESEECPMAPVPKKVPKAQFKEPETEDSHEE